MSVTPQELNKKQQGQDAATRRNNTYGAVAGCALGLVWAVVGTRHDTEMAERWAREDAQKAQKAHVAALSQATHTLPKLVAPRTANKPAP